MAAVKPTIKIILSRDWGCCEESPCIQDHMGTFYWREIIETMQPNNIKGKYDVAVSKKGREKVVRRLPPRHQSKNQVVNKNNRLGMELTSRLVFWAERKLIDILREKLPVLS